MSLEELGFIFQVPFSVGGRFFAIAAQTRNDVHEHESAVRPRDATSVWKNRFGKGGFVERNENRSHVTLLTVG
jgi:hypothetical protein